MKKQIRAMYVVGEYIMARLADGRLFVTDVKSPWREISLPEDPKGEEDNWLESSDAKQIAGGRVA